MLDDGYRYGSLVETLDKSKFISGPVAMGNPSMKPRADTIYCSRIDTYDDETTLQWAVWVQDQDFDIPKYENAHLFFPKVDEASITTESDSRFGKGGVWRHEMGFMPWIHWNRVATKYDGINVDTFKDENRDVFSMWDVDTLAIWNRRCVQQEVIFENVGAWLYNPVPVTLP
jgi:hypothetical protein